MNEEEQKKLYEAYMESVRFDRLDHHITHIREGMDEMKTTIKELSATMARLALVEERQTTSATALQKVFDRIDKIDTRVKDLETQQPLQNKATQWAERILIGGFTALIMFIFTKVGLK